MQNALVLYSLGFLAAGFLSGFLSGLFGIGGIVRILILYALFLLYEVDDSIVMHMAIGTSLALSLPSSILSFRKGYREWRASEDKDRISDFLKGWIPALGLGAVAAVIAVRYLPDWLLIAVFVFAVLFISIEVFVFRDTYSPAERFSSRITKTLTAFTTGAVSTLAGLTGVLTRTVLRAFAYPYESVYAAAAGGLLISVVGALGYMVSGLGVSGEHPVTLGYVDILAAAMMMPGSLSAPWFGKKFGHSSRLRKFKKDIISDRLTDPFTGLYKRKHFDTVLSYFVTQSDTLSTHVSVLMIDVDNLTIITKQYGQKVANSVLLEVGRLLSGCLRRIDIAARYGGDEFTVILPGADKEASLAAADRIIKSLRTTNMKSNGEEIPVSFSIGVSTYPAATVDKDSLVAGAEQAMYASKRTGRDRITHYEDVAAGRKES
jgi:diguanylate cyclase (GGDEF)-like protein